MSDKGTSASECFYRERDSRTADYLENDSPTLVPVSLHASTDACECQSGQLLLITLVNQLARLHRELRIELAVPDASLLIPTLCGGASLGDEISRLAGHIDPYGIFKLASPQLSPSKISIGIGASCRTDLTWYLGCNRSIAQLATTPCGLGHNLSADLRGAGLAALLGAAAATKSALNIETVPTTVSAWNFQSGTRADPGPIDLPAIDVGRGLMIGAGAVASATVYWLMQWGNMSAWTIVDGDKVQLHNTNRCLLFFPDDAGWPGKDPKEKVTCLSQYLTGVVPVLAWYDEAPEMKQMFDTVLVLANERNVRTLVSARNDPIQLQATTGRSWLSQLHRHIAGRDDCVRCRMSDIKSPQFSCSEAATATIDEPKRPDAALPFLSAASGLMLVSALQHLQLGDFGADRINRWSWDFRNTLCMHFSAYCECKDGCSTVLPLEARRKLAETTRWANAPWFTS